MRHADDGTGHDARHGEWQHVMEYRLLVRGTDTERRFLDRRRHSPQSGARGDDYGRQHQQCQHQAADQWRRPRHAENVDEYREAKQAEYDRWHRCEIVDADLDQIGQPGLRRELFEIDGGKNADRQTQRQRHQQRQRRANHGAGNSREFRLGTVSNRQEPPVDVLLDMAVLLQTLDPGDLLIRHPSIVFGDIVADHLPASGLRRSG